MRETASYTLYLLVSCNMKKEGDSNENSRAYCSFLYSAFKKHKRRKEEMEGKEHITVMTFMSNILINEFT